MFSGIITFEEKWVSGVWKGLEPEFTGRLQVGWNFKLDPSRVRQQKKGAEKYTAPTTFKPGNELFFVNGKLVKYNTSSVVNKPYSVIHTSTTYTPDGVVSEWTDFKTLVIFKEGLPWLKIAGSRRTGGTCQVLSPSGLTVNWISTEDWLKKVDKNDKFETGEIVYKSSQKEEVEWDEEAKKPKGEWLQSETK